MCIVRGAGEIEKVNSLTFYKPKGKSAAIAQRGALQII